MALLSRAGHELGAAGVQGIIDQPDRQRAGVYGTAKKMLGFMVDKRLARWCVADKTPRPRFSAEAFATSNDTVYALSREGPGSAGPLTAALHRRGHAGGRGRGQPFPRRTAGGAPDAGPRRGGQRLSLAGAPRPLQPLRLAGHPVECFLQSWSQGVECWGREGMAKLWSAANIRIYGGGANEEQFLEGISKVCGEVEVVTPSVADSPGGQTRSQSMRRERVLDVGTLAEVPLGRAVVMLSGAPAVVVRTTTCLEGALAPVVRASMAHHGAPVEGARVEPGAPKSVPPPHSTASTPPGCRGSWPRPPRSATGPGRPLPTPISGGSTRAVPVTSRRPSGSRWSSTSDSRRSQRPTPGYGRCRPSCVPSNPAQAVRLARTPRACPSGSRTSSSSWPSSWPR